MQAPQRERRAETEVGEDQGHGGRETPYLTAQNARGRTFFLGGGGAKGALRALRRTMGGCLSYLFLLKQGSEGDAGAGSTAMPGHDMSSVAKLKGETPFGTSSGRRMTFGYESGFHEVYRVGKELGRGQFGVTYRCQDKDSGAHYAVKTITKRSLVSADSVEDTKREVAILKRLSGHDNIVSLRGAYEDDNNIDIVMEECRGGELFDKIIAKGHYAEKDAAVLVKQMLRVVAECHLNGVIHRDLKPENFLFIDDSDDSR